MNTILNIRTGFLLTFSVVLLVFLLIVFPGTIYETDDEGLYKLFFHKNHYYLLDTFYIHHTLTKYFYTSNWALPALIPFLDIAETLLLISASVLAIVALIPLDKAAKPQSYVLLVVLTGAFVFDFVLLFAYLKIVLVSSGLITIHLFRQNSKSENSLNRWLLLGLLFLAINTRMEAALCGSLMALPIIAYQIARHGIYSKLKITFSILILYLMVGSFEYSYNKKYFSDNVKREEYYYGVFEGSYLNMQYEPENHLDSFRLNAVKTGFWCDTEFLPDAFWGKVTDTHPISIHNLLNWQKNSYKLIVLRDILLPGNVVYLLLHALLITLLIYYNRRSGLVAGASVLACYSVLILVSYLLKVESRVLSASLFVLSVGLSYTFLKEVTVVSKYSVLVILLSLSMALGYKVKARLSEYHTYQTDLQDKRNIQNVIEKKYSDKIILTDIYHLHYFLPDFGKEPDSFTVHRLVSLDMIHINLCRQLSDSDCSESYHTFARQLIAKRDSCVVIARPEFLSFYTRYMTEIQGYNIHFNIIDTCMSNENLYMFGTIQQLD